MSDELLYKIDSKLDRIQEDLSEIKVIQARHDENLQEHMRRTDILEESSEVLYEEVTQIKLHKAQMDGVFKFAGIMSAIVSGVLGLLKLFRKI